MSMTTEQALAYMHGQDNEKVSVDESKTPSVEESKSEETNVNSPKEVAAEDKHDGEHRAEDVKGSDEPKAEGAGVEKDKKLPDGREVQDHKAQRDYAFMRQKNKLRALQERYDRDTSAKDKRIKELEQELGKRKLLTSDNFTKADGSKDIDAYWNWKSEEMNLSREANFLKDERARDQQAYAIELDRINTERCFQGKELEDYDNLLAAKGQGFLEAIHEKDKNNVVLNYLDTVQDYPIVIRELMTNPTKWLPTIFRSTDEYSLKRNTAKVTDMILDEFAERQKTSSQKSQETPVMNKPAIPVMGRQISSSGANRQDYNDSLLRSISSINSYLKKHRAR